MASYNLLRKHARSNKGSISINDDDFEDAPAWGKALANNMKELTKFVNLQIDETCVMITDYAGKKRLKQSLRKRLARMNSLLKC